MRDVATAKLTRQIDREIPDSGGNPVCQFELHCFGNFGRGASLRNIGCGSNRLARLLFGASNRGLGRSLNGSESRIPRKIANPLDSQAGHRLGKLALNVGSPTALAPLIELV